MAQCLVSSSLHLTQQYSRDAESHRDPIRSSAAQVTESLYIFPAPSSTPPSPSQTPNFSNSSKDSICSSTGAHTFSSDIVDDLEQWEWSEESATNDTADHSLLEVAEDQPEEWEDPVLTRAISPTNQETQFHGWPLTLRSHPLQDYITRPSPRHPHILTSPIYAQSFHTLSTASNSMAFAPTLMHSKLPPSPHARIHVPFLSLFLSFLSVDSSTVHLLSHTSQHSVLFPGDTVVSDPFLAASDSRRLEVDEDFSVYGRLREGHAITCDYQDDLISPLFGFTFKRFSSLWSFVHDFVRKGGETPVRNYVA
ncbi:hypothetical protein AX15_002676 [Amanita polypyramis BW_CC]|nr:hypothetical protein AX15_002676 [Amanita polypyramis BW_CC]